jgi:sugar phosphate isomerase/epimerase
VSVHSRVSLHQVAFAGAPTAAFLDHCRTIGVGAVTLVTSLVGPDERAELAHASDGPRVATVNHNFAVFPDLERDDGAASDRLLEAVDLAAAVGAGHVYLLTGGRGTLDWTAAAHRFAQLVAPGRDAAALKGVTLLVENASPFNADIHMAHTLADAVTLAAWAGIGVCVDLHACWTEGGLSDLFKRALPSVGLVQVSDYVLGDRSAPCRAVPGDGAIPLRRILGDVLDAGYQGLFDLELVGPRITAEGAHAATTRAAEYLSTMLDELGA